MSKLHADATQLTELGKKVADLKTKLHDAEVHISQTTPDEVDWLVIVTDAESLVELLNKLSGKAPAAPEPVHDEPTAPPVHKTTHHKGHK